MTQGRALLFLAAAALSAEAYATEPEQPKESARRLGHPSMGSLLEAEWEPLPGREAKAERAIQEALSEADRVEAAFSHYLPGSELSRFNALPKGSSEGPSKLLLDLFQRAERWRRRSGGAFSCRLQPWLALKGFIPPPPGCAPSADAMQERTSPLAIVLQRGRFTKRQDGAGLDFDGIAKGYALELAAGRVRGKTAWAFLSYGSTGILTGKGGERALVVTDPRQGGPNAPAAAAIWLRKGAFSTSSCAENRRGGLCHILDPMTLEPSSGGLLSATVFAGSAADCDALSTALLVLGPDLAASFAAENGAEAFFLSDRPFDGAVPWKGLWAYTSQRLRPFVEMAP